VAKPAPATVLLTQAEVDRLARVTFGNAKEINAHFGRTGSAGFAEWFNAQLGGKAPFVRPGKKLSPMTMPVSAGAKARFTTFWDGIPLAFDRRRITALDFAALTCITLNETGGDFVGHTEKAGKGRPGHPGLAYLFDRFELRPGRFKASYNTSPSNRTAGSLFNDPVFTRAHGALDPKGVLANHGDGWSRAWHGDTYPQAHFSTSETDPSTAFIRETDFYKFRGRGVIQTTHRESYKPFIRFIQGYTGGDPTLLGYKKRWAGLSADDAATVSTTKDWDTIFGVTEILARGLSFHADPSGAGKGDYRTMSTDAALLQEVPSASGTKKEKWGRNGAIYSMGRRISGSYDYGAKEYRDRVIALLRAMLAIP
jgi:hypothetical protein